MTAFSTFTKHGLSNGDTVRISNLGGLDGDYRVVITGLADGTFKDYYFVLDIDPTSVSIGGNTRMKRVVNGQESEYYFRIFEKVKTTENSEILRKDYELFDTNVSKSIFKDPQYQLVLNTDIDVNGLTDNLGRPVTEMYYTFLKTDSNNKFTVLKSGIESALVEGVTSNLALPDIRQIHNAAGSNTPLEDGNNVSYLNIDANQFYGDVVEYNKFEVREKILSEVRHRFNTPNRDTNSPSNAYGGSERIEGYFYKPHYQIKIREFSSYVEQGDESVFNVPDYAEDLGDGRLLWRDFLDIGFSDNGDTPLDYPFTNGAHYIHQDIVMLMKRQDPFGQYGLLYNASVPNDILGETQVDDFRVNITDKIC
jgi:hypothetical protein